MLTLVVILNRSNAEEGGNVFGAESSSFGVGYEETSIQKKEAQVIKRPENVTFLRNLILDDRVPANKLKFLLRSLNNLGSLLEKIDRLKE
ncbi:hypothetical protein Tco_0405935, partial [Tanacetum coccineum]